MSPQSQDLYRTLLSSREPLNAKTLAEKLRIFPNSVYRLIDPLMDMGLITRTKKYPYKFIARPLNEGLSLFLLNQNDWFSKEFSHSKKKGQAEAKREISEFQQVSISFIQSRNELMNLSAVEIGKARKSIDLLRSGGEIPADVMLATIEAKQRGVPTRMLIQDYSEANIQQVANWIRNGIEVRKTELKHIRLMIYDNRTIYFMSYRHDDSTKDMGMKIEYAPFAAILSQLFESWWSKADIIN